MKIKEIKTAEDHQIALARVDEIWNAEPNSLAGDELESLITLIQKFEDENFAIAAPNAVEKIKFRIDQESL
ncbi:MAG: transcriptional regulator [Pseudomonas sp.]|nr:transcriptional regulator [Pseudomonas sp.]